MPNERILILEDDTAFAKVLAENLSGFGVTRFTSYPERLPEIISDFKPTLLIVDYNLNHPTLNGIKATRMVRQNAATNLLPVLLLSGVDDMAVIEEAYKSGIDDYVLKPVSPRFLIAKIENLLFQTRKKLNAQALSGLPGNSAIETEFYLRLQKKRNFAVVYTDLDNFKPFNDEKGVKKGDDAIQIVARILHSLRSGSSREDLFVGHLGGDDFFLLGSATQVQRAVKKLHRLFTSEVRQFFNSEELEAGFYRGTDRQGRLTLFPLLTISSAVITAVSKECVPDFLTLTQIAASAKKAAKKSQTRVFQLSADGLPVKHGSRSLFAEERSGAKKSTARKQAGTK